MGTLLLSRWSLSVHLVHGRPGGRFHVGSGGRPTDSSASRGHNPMTVTVSIYVLTPNLLN